MYKLNLGCGPDHIDGWENIDKFKFNGETVVIDLEKCKLPYPDNSVMEIKAFHILEHLHNWLKLMNECHRVLAPNCVMEIKVPRFPSDDAVKDPTHVSFFVPETFLYLTVYLAQGLFKMYKIKHWDLVCPVRSTETQMHATLKACKEEK